MYSVQESVGYVFSASNDVFQYKPLDQAAMEIRLVQFIKPEASDDDSIRLSLVHASLESDIDYFALSYTWGAPFTGMDAEWDDASAFCSIQVNGCEFKVRLNLESALRYFKGAWSKSFPMWIDAICINQSDAEEKEGQVRMMKQIYEKSKGTQVWLGPATGDSDLAMQTLAQFGKAWETRDEALQHFDLQLPFVLEETRARYRDLVESELGLPDFEQRCLALSTLFARAWWYRAWVVQEVVVSANASFHCAASESVPWSEFLATHKLIQQHCLSLTQVCEGKDDIFSNLVQTARAGDRLLKTRELWEMYHAKVDPPLLVPERLFLFRSALATDPRDKIYAAVGIANDGSTMDISYTRDAVTTFSETTRIYTEASQNLYMLQYCSRSILPGLPSWAADWTCDNLSSRLPLWKQIRVLERTGRPTRRVYSAGGQYSVNFLFDEDGRTLYLVGIVADIVSFLGQPVEPIDNESRSILFGL
jgi:hypothetical protein